MKKLLIAVLLLLVSTISLAHGSFKCSSFASKNFYRQSISKKCYINSLQIIASSKHTIVRVYELWEKGQRTSVLRMADAGIIGFTNEKYNITILHKDSVYVEFLFDGENLSCWTFRESIECY